MNDPQARRRATDRFDVDQVFAGGGEMGALMSALDWSKTLLGPVSTWSQALRTTVGLLLRNPFPLLLWWGPKFVQIYNDAYRPIPGAKHPVSIGQPASECWAEIWDIIGPMIEAPFRGEPATWSDDLELFHTPRGFLEETHYKVAYSPVPDETAATGIGGVLATVAEITAQVQGERQLRTLRELGTHAAEATTSEDACARAAATLGASSRDVPFALFYLLDSTGKIAHLCGTCGLKPGEHPAAPRSIALAGGSLQTGWPLDRVVGESLIEVVTDIDKRFDLLPASDQGKVPHTAIVLPLGSPNWPRIDGFVILGVSPHRELDEGYRSYFEVAAAQVVTAIRNARAHQDARKRAEALAEVDLAKTTFFSNVSHEFRTPLTLILGPLGDARSNPGGALAGESLDTVHRNALRLLKLVNTLLDFSRIEAGRTRANYQRTDLSVLTADLASAFRSLLEKAGLTLTVDCPPMAEPVYVDREMYEKLVFNLLSNAFKFTFKGGIRVSLHAGEGQVRLVVADTGTGIPEGELPHLFERFHRVEGAKGRSYEGSGIGLALVQELAKAHGGSISVESRIGEGSHFTVALPLGRVHLPPEQIEVASPLAVNGPGATLFLDEASQWLLDARVGPAAPNSYDVAPTADDVPSSRLSARILLADDNPDMREYLRRLLTAQGWEVQAVGDGEAALERVRARVPDLVLTDVMMPGLDGFGLLQALKQEERTRAVPVILLSARAGEAALIEGMQKGADDYLVKPFSAKELVSRVAARLEIARARAEAVEARARLHAQFMQAPVPVSVIIGPDLVYELANPAYLELVGRKDVVGKSIRAVFPELSGDSPILQIVESVFSSGKPFTADEYCVPLDRKGTGIAEDGYFKFTVQPVRDAAGKVTGVMMVAVDVTAHVDARERVRDALDFTRAVTGSLGEGVLATDLEGRLTLINPAAREMLGWKEDEALGKLVQEIVQIRRADGTPITADEYPFNLVMRKGDSFRTEEQLFSGRSRSSFPVSCTASALRQGGEQISGAVLAFQDISERKQAETLLASHQQALEMLAKGEQLEQVLDFLARSMESQSRNEFRVAIHLMEEDGQHFGYVAAPSLPASYAQATKGLDASLQTGPCSTAVMRHEPTIVHDFAAETRWPAFSAEAISLGLRACLTTPIVASDQRILGTFVIYYREPRDPTPYDHQLVEIVNHTASIAIEQRLADRRTESLIEELKVADLRKDEFLALLAHELRNPMAAISMALSMLERVEGDAVKSAKYRETARRQMGSLVRLVDDLLDVSRITSGKVELRKEEVELASIVQNALTATRSAIEARGHTLTLTVESGVLRMDADATRLEQVVVNLLVNAAKYTDPGGTISVRLAREVVKGAAQAVLAVRDTGHGIPKDMLDKVFDLFVQVSPTIHHAAGGLGLGLTLVRRLVEMHGGTVAAMSEGVGKGSEFVVRLPLSEGNQGEMPLHAGGPTEQTSPAPQRRRIVVVEDSEDVRETLKEFLEALGHEVTVAVSGPLGVAKVLELLPEVALVDVGLPGFDGYEVARRIRAESGGDKVYLVALTGYGSPDVKDKAKRAGFDLHLTKPVDINELRQVVGQTRPRPDVH